MCVRHKFGKANWRAHTHPIGLMTSISVGVCTNTRESAREYSVNMLQNHPQVSHANKHIDRYENFKFPSFMNEPTRRHRDGQSVKLQRAIMHNTCINDAHHALISQTCVGLVFHSFVHTVHAVDVCTMNSANIPFEHTARHTRRQ